MQLIPASCNCIAVTIERRADNDERFDRQVIENLRAFAMTSEEQSRDPTANLRDKMSAIIVRYGSPTHDAFSTLASSTT